MLISISNGKSRKNRKILDILEEKGIKKETIEENYGWICTSNLAEIDKLFSKDTGNLKKYMRIKGLYNKVLSEEEINSVLKEKEISIEEFFTSIIGEYFTEMLSEEYKERKTIYIGKSIPIEKQYMKQYAKELMELAKRVSRNFTYKYGIKDIEEIQDQAIEVILTKCGDITYNYSKNIEIAKRCIYSKVFKYLKLNLNNKEILSDLKELERSKKYYIEEKGYNDEKLDLDKWNLNNEQKTILNLIYEYIEEGYTLKETIEKMEKITGIDSEEILEQIEEIKIQIKENEKENKKEGETK